MASMDTISRNPTIDASLNEAEGATVISDWAHRPAAANDLMLRRSFLGVLAESQNSPPEEKLVMYDACDEEEVTESLGAVRKRLDARRNTKPKKAADQLFVCTPFNPSGFHFGKISNERERLVKLQLGSEQRYDILTNKFPLFPKHMLLVADALVPQQMTGTHLSAITELLSATTGFCAYFNSWCASASVNHFHCHLIDEYPPVTAFPLVAGPLVMGVRCLQPQGFPGFCYVFPKSKTFPQVDAAVRAMQQDNQPHNMLFTPRFIYVFPKPIVRPERTFDLYPETVGGPELIGSFTVYNREVYDGLAPEHVDELCRINTAPLPSRLLQHAGSASGIDDMVVCESATTDRALSLGRGSIAPSLTASALPSFPSLHDEDWPQDRPIARALAYSARNSFV